MSAGRWRWRLPGAGLNVVGHDRTGEVEDGNLAQSGIGFTSDPDDIAAASIDIIAAPAPVDAVNVPDMGAVLAACRMIGPHMHVDIKSALWDLRHLLPDAGAQNYWAF